jgi:hypothetical protein
MKRGLLFMFCLLLLALAGCTAVNQTNSFVVMPQTAEPEASATPAVTPPPEIIWLPAEQTDLPPTNMPEATDTQAPAATDTPAPTAAPTPTQAPENSPGGFNG